MAISLLTTSSFNRSGKSFRERWIRGQMDRRSDQHCRLPCRVHALDFVRHCDKRARRRTNSAFDTSTDALYQSAPLRFLILIPIKLLSGLVTEQILCSAVENGECPNEWLRSLDSTSRGSYRSHRTNPWRRRILLQWRYRWNLSSSCKIYSVDWRQAQASMSSLEK